MKMKKGRGKIFFLCFFLSFLLSFLSCSLRNGGTVSFSFSIHGIPETELTKSSPSYSRIRSFSVNPDYTGRKFFVSFPKYIKLKRKLKLVSIELTTDFPGSVSVVISRGFFGGVKVLPMICRSVEENKKLCTTEIERDKLMRFSLGGREPIFFWFMLRVGEASYYTVPNIKIIQRGRKIHDVLGRIYVER